MSKDWLIVQFYCTGTSEQVGYFYKPDAEIFCKHFGQFGDLRALHHGDCDKWNGTQLEKELKA